MGLLSNSGYTEIPEYGCGLFSSLAVSSPEAMIPLSRQEQLWFLLVKGLTFGLP